MPQVMIRSRKNSTRGFTLIELLVAIAIIGILIALLLPAVQQAREAARRTQCRSHLKQLSLALHNYHSTYSRLPSGSLTVGPAFRPFSGWGWGAMLLPYLDQSPLYGQLDFSINTAVGTNRTAIQTSLPIWFCPTDVSPRQISVSSLGGDTILIAAGNYPGVESMLKEISSVKFADVTDGLSQTFLLGEHRYERSAITGDETTSSWLGRVTFTDHYIFNAIPHAAASELALVNQSVFSSLHTGGAFFALGDASVQFISESIDSGVYAALGTRSGGETVDLPF
ncbi:MAG: DUF1559 domain-containing protein [Planctomycetaceae bacterium]